MSKFTKIAFAAALLVSGSAFAGPATPNVAVPATAAAAFTKIDDALLQFKAIGDSFGYSATNSALTAAGVKFQLGLANSLQLAPVSAPTVSVSYDDKPLRDKTTLVKTDTETANTEANPTYGKLIASGIVAPTTSLSYDEAKVGTATELFRKELGAYTVDAVYKGSAGVNQLLTSIDGASRTYEVAADSVQATRASALTGHTQSSNVQASIDAFNSTAADGTLNSKIAKLAEVSTGLKRVTESASALSDAITAANNTGLAALVSPYSVTKANVDSYAQINSATFDVTAGTGTIAFDNVATYTNFVK